MKDFSYCFTFICQQGELEINAILLAASLKQNLRCNYEMIAAIPSPASLWGTPSKQTLDLLYELGVKTVEVKNMVNDNYPICNKIGCASIPTNADKVVFLDSDTMCISEFHHHPRFVDDAFHAKAAGVATYSKETKDWQILYELFGLNYNEVREITTVSGETMPPYFNSGFWAMKPNLEFSKIWAESCKKIAESAKIDYTLHYLDQIGLSVAIALIDKKIDFLDEHYNYPGQQRPININRIPTFCHYHYPVIIRREPILYKLVYSFLKKYPHLVTLMNQYPEWSPLTKRYLLSNQNWWKKSRTSIRLPEAILTGIPRSGTSYLCRILHQVKESIVINEPQEIFSLLPSTQDSWQMANYYRDLRCKIIEGVPIENKIKNGLIIEDTRICDERIMYNPEVNCDDFLLSTKNTVAYMARLPQLHKIMPDALIVAMVRHPLDTISSWKKSFPQLELITVNNFPFGHPDDPMIDYWQRQQLHEISMTKSPIIRRALFWRYLGMVLLENRDIIHLVKYEDLVTNPIKEIRTILQLIPNSPKLSLVNPIRPSHTQHLRNELSRQEMETISGICGHVAREFGYEILI